MGKRLFVVGNRVEMARICRICGQKFEARNELDTVTLFAQHLFFVHGEEESADKVLLKAIRKSIQTL